MSLLGFFVGLAGGFFAKDVARLARSVYWHWRTGTCWRYRSSRRFVLRGGTYSDFCARCGRPYGYHRP